MLYFDHDIVGVKYMKKVLNVVFALCVLVSCSSLFLLSASADSGSKKNEETNKSDKLIKNDKVKYYVIPYVIRKGDTLSQIYWLWGLDFDDYSEDIKSINCKDDLDLLYIGNTIMLPTTVGNVKTDNYTKVMAHTIKKGETAYDIVTAYGIDYLDNEKLIRRYNRGSDLTKLKKGDELLIPIISDK